MKSYRINDKFRLKVTDRCNFSCSFCHFEGGKNEGDVLVNTEFSNILQMLRPVFNRVHITGGEPMLYRNLNGLLDMIENYGYKTAVTTNGFFSLAERVKMIEKMEYINFSVHSFQEKYVGKRIIRKGANVKKVLECVKHNIEEVRLFLPVRVNTVVSDVLEQRVEELVDFCGEKNIELKLVPEWSVREKAKKSIYELLERYHFEPFEQVYFIPGSNVRKRYKNKYGQVIEVKDVEFYLPDFLCGDCMLKKVCREGYSFLRVGGNPLYFQPCILKNKIDTDEFQKNVLPHVFSMFREAEQKCRLYMEKEGEKVNGIIID